MPIESVPDALAQLRNKAGYSVESVARLCDLSAAELSDIEKGFMGLPIGKVKKLFSVYGIEISILMKQE